MPIVGLHREHWKKLLASGLSPETSRRAQIYTEYDGGRLRLMLSNSSAEAPALILPGFDRHGERSGFDVARMMPPHRRHDGTLAKYLIPTGSKTRAYFPPLRCVQEAMNEPGRTLVITEGILKALASSQAGVPCIGLMGTWNWVVKNSNPRKLILDLEEIDWEGRLVLVVFDFDAKRKPSVNHAAAELGAALTRKRAKVRILQPPVAGDAEGKYTKQAIDDFIVRQGAPAYRKWIEQQLTEEPVRSIVGWRKEMAQLRLQSLGQSGVFLDRGLPGVGKSYADGHVLRELEGRSLTVVPTHAHCQQVVSEHARQGVTVVAAPKLDETSCRRFEEADPIQQQGLAVPVVLCPRCDFRDGCAYHRLNDAASAAQHTVITHKRGEQQMSEVMRQRQYLAIHEDPVNVIRPTYAVVRDLSAIAFVAEQAGFTCGDPQARLYFRHMQNVANELKGLLEGSSETTDVPLPEPASNLPKNRDFFLWQGLNVWNAKVDGNAMRLVKAATDGELDGLRAKVETREKRIPCERSLAGTGRVPLPDRAPVWLNDATADQAELERVLGRPIADMTPRGLVERRHKVLQIIPKKDVTRRRSVVAVAELLRGILHDLHYELVGVLTHRPLIQKGLKKKLKLKYSRRISMLEHFGGNHSRGSNDWIERCDCLIVLGTPRVPPDAIRCRLTEVGKHTAASMTEDKAGWSHDYWSGTTESGQRVTVRTWHYRDHDWHEAYCNLVVGGLKQAVGRARPILDNGIPVFVVTTEDIGETIADHPFLPLTNKQSKAIQTLYRNGLSIRRKTAEIAESLDISRQAAMEMLKNLESAKRVASVENKRRVWFSTAPF